ncbi:hypothetical protein EU537_08430 [Candidatus Thorarchaeota archaeon]|nr:MAG: hypothetical protein EU537_08430 [Candidatus Thorarchaeota archaeon]
MSYLTWREYVRSGPVCLGAILVIAGAVWALLPTMGITVVPDYDTIIGAAVAVVGLILILIGFFMTTKKRDSVLRPVDTRQEDVPPPPPPPD